MPALPSVDRRHHQRHPLPTSVRFFHEPSQREYPARCVDISSGGMLMYVPVTTPVQPGHVIRLNLGDIPRPEYSGIGKRPIDATIVRVARQQLVSMGQVAVGVRFQQISQLA